MTKFERVVVISLGRRRDRLWAFLDRFLEAWPGTPLRLFTAVDGSQEALPDGWRGTAGAWGCARSHEAVVAQALTDGVERLLVLEDDATFVPGFAERLAGLRIPGTCQMLYLGGEHLLPPQPVWPGLVLGRNVNRTHAYAILGRPALETIREHLRWHPARWTAAHNVDHQLGILHETARVAVYAADPWMCGQAAGRSDIDGREWPARAWERQVD
ncbi:MAG: glycosyltransferase family 25 protein [Planctomycetes bacterium]|nr:glycosyltransferase family 25 protein [Planctomycetota bacterium]